MATVLSFVIGTLLGILAAWRRGGRLDRSLPAFTLLQAMPYFFLALLADLLLLAALAHFPIGQGTPWGYNRAGTGPSSRARSTTRCCRR